MTQNYEESSHKTGGNEWHTDLYAVNLLIDLEQIEDKDMLLHFGGCFIKVQAAIDGIRGATTEGKMFYDLDPQAVGVALEGILSQQEKNRTMYQQAIGWVRLMLQGVTGS